MRERALLTLVLVALAATCAGAATAAAAPLDLGPGRNPHLAVDSSGAAHVTWNEIVSGQLADVAHYCQIAKGASACASPHTFTYPSGANQGSDSGVWPLLPGDPRVLVIDARCCTQYAAKFLYSSTDAGTTFDAGTNVGNDNNAGADIQGSALYAPAGALGRPAESVLTLGSLATVGLSFQATGTVGPPSQSSSQNILTQGDATSGSLGLAGNTLVAAWTNIDDTNVYWRQWTGSGDVNNSASWSPITQLDIANIDANTRLASGPSGIYVAYNTGSPGAQRTVERRFTGSGWGAPNTLADPGVNNFDFAEDPAGALHFVYANSAGGLGYRFSTTPGDSSFSAPQTLFAGPPFSDYINVRLGVGTGSGLATWEDGSPVHVMALSFKPSTLAPPTEGSTVNAVPTKGKVLVKLPPGSAGKAKDPWTRAAAAGFVPLESLGRQIPVGSTLDTTKGTVRLFSATTNTGKTQNGDFSRGLFSIGQGRKNPLTTISMTGGSLGSCGKVPPGGSPKPAFATAAKTKRRSLFSNVHGRFSTRGRNSAATVRGTSFTMTDTCAGTLTQVKTGTVSVRDFVLRKTRTVKAGHSYFARRGHR
jgi:hypothetical protein